MLWREFNHNKLVKGSVGEAIIDLQRFLLKQELTANNCFNYGLAGVIDKIRTFINSVNIELLTGSNDINALIDKNACVSSLYALFNNEHAGTKLYNSEDVHSIFKDYYKGNA